MKLKEIAICKFEPDKYGTPTDVDITDVESFRDFLWKYPVYSTDYYSVFLVLKGNERIEVNGVAAGVHPGMIICSLPGGIWRWEEKSEIDGLYLYWTETFLSTFFNDARFIERFSYFNAARESSFMYPDTKMFRQVLTLMHRMNTEIDNGLASNDKAMKTDDSQHMLRALVYETLMLLDRIERIPVREDRGETILSGYVIEFQRLIREHICKEHSVEYYADRLFITANYLNKIVKVGLGTSTKKYIKAALIEESKKLLQYTRKPVNEIADELCLDPIYFIKWFRQVTGSTPLQYRKKLNTHK